MVERINWLRAAVLGATDGIILTGSLIVGVAAAMALKQDMMIAGVAGAMSMAAGEYVPVSAQSDSEGAKLEKGAQRTPKLSGGGTYRVDQNI